MSPAIRNALVAFLTRMLGALAPSGGVNDPVASALTAAHLGALPRFLALIPIGDLIALANGTGNADNLLDVVEAGATVVARAFPPGAIAAGEVRLGLEALQILIDAAGLGSTPIHVTGGYRPPTGGFDGARGHI